MDEQLRLCSLNTRGLRDSRKRVGLFHWFKRYKKGNLSFVFLQETHSDVSQETVWKNEWGADVFFSHGSTNARGVAILCPKMECLEVVKIEQDNEGRILIVEANISGKRTVLCNVYAPTQNQVGQQSAFLDKLCSKLTPYQDEDCALILGGDLNTYLDPALDKYQRQHSNVEKTDYACKITDICVDFSLIDCWRVINPNLKRYTWRQPNPLRQSILDYWLISADLFNLVTDCDIQPSYKTDHSLITLEIGSTGDSMRGPGMWKFNVSLLRDVEYVQKCKEWLADLQTEYDNLENKALKWELIKCGIRRETISYSKAQKKKKNLLFSNLIKDMKILESKLSQDPTDSLVLEYRLAKQQMDEIVTHEAQGAAFRTRLDHLEFNENNSRYFARLEKANYKKKMVSNLIVGDRHLTNFDDILKEQARFYKDLYSAKGTDSSAQAKFLEQTVPVLDNQCKSNCEEDISIEELGRALKALPNGKTPGSDGFNADFYKFFWGSINELVFESLTYSLIAGELSCEQKRGVITLIPKKDKDTRHLKNWRPISLLNTDYKILTKLLAMRMQRALPNVINEDQVGYLKGRYIGQNIRTIFDIIEYSKKTATPGMVIFLDFEKAFDSIEWCFLLKSLESFGFGKIFMNWIKIIYHNTNSCIINNGYTTEYFSLERGIRQGCPLSAYLFITAVELLAEYVRQNEQIKGIKVFNTEIKLIQMADDTTAFLNDIDSLKVLLQDLYSFSKASGLKLNKSKTEAMWLGSNDIVDDQSCGVKWVTESYSLGFWFTIQQEDGIVRNFSDRFDRFCRALNMWKNRYLSLKGKITVIKSIAMPILLYATSNLPIPEGFVKNVKQQAYKFIWNDKPDKIKREVLCSEIEKGGLKMIDFDLMFKAQKTMWVKRLASDNKASWKAYPLGILGEMGIDILKCSFHPGYMPVDITLFYHQMLYAWGECKQITDKITTAWDVRRQSIFFNEDIQIGHKYIGAQLMHWYRHGIFMIHDIVDEKGCFLSMAKLKDMYNIHLNVLLYNSLKDAIPIQWRRLLNASTVYRHAISKLRKQYIYP